MHQFRQGTIGIVGDLLLVAELIRVVLQFRTTRVLLEAIGLGQAVDFIVEHYERPGWVGDVIHFFGNPIVQLAIILSGIGLILWDNRRTSNLTAARSKLGPIIVLAGVAIVTVGAVVWALEMRHSVAPSGKSLENKAAGSQPPNLSDRVYLDLNPRDILTFYEGRTPLKAESMIAPFKGGWIETQGVVVNLFADGDGSIALLKNGTDSIECRFNPTWTKQARNYSRDDTMKIRGKIAPTQNGSQLYLTDCEIVPDDRRQKRISEIRSKYKTLSAEILAFISEMQRTQQSFMAGTTSSEWNKRSDQLSKARQESEALFTDKFAFRIVELYNELDALGIKPDRRRAASMSYFISWPENMLQSIGGEINQLERQSEGLHDANEENK